MLAYIELAKTNFLTLFFTHAFKIFAQPKIFTLRVLSGSSYESWISAIAAKLKTIEKFFTNFNTFFWLLISTLWKDIFLFKVKEYLKNRYNHEIELKELKYIFKIEDKIKKIRIKKNINNLKLK